MKFFALAAVTALLATPAFATDNAVYTEKVPAVADTFSWTGGYVGVNAGYAVGKFEYPISLGAYGEDGWFNVGSGSIDVAANGFVGGIQTGYNWQFDTAVVGIETDIQAASLKGEFSGDIDKFINLGVGTKINWIGTARVRLGYLPTARFMIYATGGVAYGKVETYASINAFGESAVFSDSETKLGYTAGVGAEYAINNNWTFKSEYFYTDLGKTKFTLANDNLRENVEAKIPFHTVRVGVNYKF